MRGSRWMETVEGRVLMSTSSFYVQGNLVSDGTIAATHTDPGLVNAWGLDASPTGPWWVASAGKGTVPAYDSTGATAAPTFAIPEGADAATASPTGVVFNSTGGFVLKKGKSTAPSGYVVVTENGTISGWNPALDAGHAILEVDHSSLGAVYKGAAIGQMKGKAFLYVANFHSGRIEMFDSSFDAVATKSAAFRDLSLPAGYAPFNVKNIGGELYVSYALQDGAAHDDVAGPRHGFIDVFSTKGVLLRRFASRGSLDSPWGMVVAPHDFGLFSDDILVGNFGNGKISAFSKKGKFLGFVNGSDGAPIEIEGLWGLAFGNGGEAGPKNVLYFASGPSDESHGLFGSLAAGKSHKHGGGGTLGY